MLRASVSSMVCRAAMVASCVVALTSVASAQLVALNAESPVVAVLGNEQYEWLFILTLVATFVSAFAIGANDVANAFADAVAARTLTLRQVVGIAFFTEFLGAVVLGNNTTKAIRKGIIDVDLFETRQDLLMWAMFSALVGAGCWVLIATYLKWPVSTTHSIVGAVTGVGIAAFGADGVNWSADSGVGRIFIGFVLSPIMSGVAAMIFFMTTKLLILERSNSWTRALYATPVYAFCTTLIIMFFFVYKGSPKLGLSDRTTGFQMTIIWPPTIFVTLLSIVLGIPYLRRNRATNKASLETAVQFDAQNKKAEAAGAEAGEGDATVFELDLDSNVYEKPKAEAPEGLLNKAWFYFFYGVNQDVSFVRSEKQQKMLDAATSYDDDTEGVFQWLQIFSSGASSFAHGANDVANAIAPLATVFAIYSDGAVGGSKAEVPTWVLAFGGAGMNLGLFFLGYRLMENLGNNLTYLSPSRGVSLEVAAILTVLTATALELPVSTTHCITGATIAVGLCQGNFKLLNTKVVLTTLFGWMLTLPFAGLVAGLVYSIGAYTPTATFTDLFQDFNASAV